MSLKISCQEQLLPNGTLEEKYETALAWGFTSLELRGRGDGQFAARLPDLQRALANGVEMPTLCVEMLHFVCDFDDALRRDALDQMNQQIDTFASVGGRVVVTPASYGMFSRRLPPFEPPRSAEDDRAVLEDSFGQLADRAQRAGVVVAIEPLNRYEDYLVNNLDDAVALIASIGNPALKICADTYHMNIEEADPIESLLRHKDHIAYVQVSDSNRLEPGAGHIDWEKVLHVLEHIPTLAPPAYECRLSGDAETVLPQSTAFLRSVR